ncbi:MAG: ATP-binding cassette domain-containing protein, partial [Bifidobacteriaceae bacterium]|nr:ATP-binding cassette domain-containing protein [Bifidobacteriaceae bacterium]
DIELPHATKEQIHQVRLSAPFVFQNFNLFKNRTALGNVMEGLVTPRKVPVAEAQERARAALDKVGLNDKYDSYPAQLSGGQQQRVAIARALVLEPKVVLFDEPTSALDPELITEVLTVMRLAAAEGVTMVVVTHELGFARDVANQVIFMDGGLVVEAGPPAEVLARPQEPRTQQFLNIFPDNYTI